MIERARHPHDVDRLLEDVERLVTEGVARARAFPRRQAARPAVDLYDSGTELVVKALLPGGKPEEIDVSIEQNTLLLQGRFGAEMDESAAKRVTWYRRDIGAGEFAEAIPLPIAVEADQVTASFVDGILTLTLPKVAQARSRKIPVGAPRSLAPASSA